ncbi:virulence-associated protein E [Nitrospirillum amazonense]|uniref:Virulence-associated protein E n=1 Tax=Nitrospirillum amazonense TaxID=28077 RepID=A0A560FLU5_9PROT|nr:virulence-associated protein E [Nitrospirillum amazonense]
MAKSNEANHVRALTTVDAFGCTAVYLDDFTGELRLGAAVTLDDLEWPQGALVDDAFVSCVITTMRLRRWSGIKATTVWDTLVRIGRKNRRDPLRDFLMDLTWDGQERLDLWLGMWGGADDTPLNRVIGRKWLCAAVGRVMTPGLKFDSVLLMHGRKGLGKSTALKVMGGEWFAEAPALGLRDGRSNHAMHGAWMAEVPEVDRVVATARDAAAFKAWITKTEDRTKPPYARTFVNIPRRWVLAATTNETEWMHDVGGERRWWPVEVIREVDVEGLRENREQILAEAVAKWRDEALYMDLAETREALTVAMGDLAEDNPLADHVGLWVADETRRAAQEPGGVLGLILRIDDVPQTEGVRISLGSPKARKVVKDALRDLGMVSRRPKVSGVKGPMEWRWPDEITSNRVTGLYPETGGNQPF